MIEGKNTNNSNISGKHQPSNGLEGPAYKKSSFADIVLLNGKIATVDKVFSLAEGIAIEGSKIIEVGSETEIRKYINTDTTVINLNQRTVIPGIIDAHLHPEQASLSELDGEIPNIRSIDELLQWIKIQTETKTRNEWIIIPKFFFTRLKEKRYPTLVELDTAAPTHPVFLNGSFGGMINSAGMSISNINNNTTGSGVLKNSKGSPNGVLRRSAFKLLNIPFEEPYSEEQQADALVEMLKAYNHYGITSICSGAGDLQTLKMYHDLKKKNKLTCRVNINIRVPLDLKKSDSTEHILETPAKLGFKTGDGDSSVRIGALKIILDGGILTGTAYMREPWGKKAKDVFGFEDPEYKGTLNYSFDELVKIISLAARSGWKFAAHCTGGGGVDLLLDAFEKVNESIPLKGKRFAIIHGNFFTSEAIIRMKDLGIYADIQAAWFYKDADAMKDILGEKRVNQFLPFRSLLNAGVVINGGSDHMVKYDADTSINPFNPFLAIWSMVTRKTENGNIINKDEVISRQDALKIYTINNAYASFEESSKGSIEMGKLADISVLSHDLLTCPEDQIKKIKSVLTMVGGRIVHNSGEINY